MGRAGGVFESTWPHSALFFAAEVRASIDGVRGKKRAKASGRFGGGASGDGGVFGGGNSCFARGWRGRGEEVETGGGGDALGEYAAVAASSASPVSSPASVDGRGFGAELSEATHPSDSEECETDIDACWSDDIDDIGLGAVSGGLIGLDDALDALAEIDDGALDAALSGGAAAGPCVRSVGGQDDGDVLTFLDDFVVDDDEGALGGEAERRGASPRAPTSEGSDDRASSLFW